VRISLRRRNKVKHVKTHFRHAESDGRFNYAIPPGKRSGALIVRIPWRSNVLRRANDEDKGGDEGVERWGDRGMADYAKDFHNIRRLKFSHNIQPCAAARQWEKAEKGRARTRRRRARKRARRRRRRKRRRRSQAEACVALGVLG